MKSILLFATLVLSLTTFASESEMKELVKVTNASIHSQEFDRDYRAVKIDRINIQGGLKSFLTKTTQAKMKDWKDFVMNSDDFDQLSYEEKLEKSKYPLKELDVKYLLEISEVYEIYNGNRLIGYFIEVVDHVQGAIYQDGAWYDTFFDTKLKLIESVEQSA